MGRLFQNLSRQSSSGPFCKIMRGRLARKVCDGEASPVLPRPNGRLLQEGVPGSHHGKKAGAAAPSSPAAARRRRGRRGRPRQIPEGKLRQEESRGLQVGPAERQQGQPRPAGVCGASEEAGAAAIGPQQRSQGTRSRSREGSGGEAPKGEGRREEQQGSRGLLARRSSAVGARPQSSSPAARPLGEGRGKVARGRPGRALLVL